MSQAHRPTVSPFDLQEWERVLVQLRAHGFSPIESIKVTRAEFEQMHKVACAVTDL